jgi:predicted aspartyl protease
VKRKFAPLSREIFMFPIDLGRRDTTFGLLASLGTPLAMTGCAGVSPTQGVMNLATQQPPIGQTGDPQHGASASVISTAIDPSLRMTAPVFINGSGPFQFIVDTGANISVLTTDLATELGVPPGPLALVHGIAGSFFAHTAYVGTLSVGSVKISRLTMPMMAIEFVGAQGIIGVDVLRDRVVQLDLLENKLYIGSSAGSMGSASGEPLTVSGNGSRIPRRDSVNGMVAVPARYRFGQLTVVDADVDGVPIVAFLDSGSQTTVGNGALLRGLDRRRPSFAERTRRVTILSATGQTADAELGVLPDLRLGGLRIRNVSAAFSDLHAFQIWDLTTRPAILIGMDVLRHFNKVELDFVDKQVLFYLPGRFD